MGNQRRWRGAKRSSHTRCHRPAPTGRSSILETAMIDSRDRGVLDTPPARGMTAVCGAGLVALYRTSTFLNCQGSEVSMSSGNSPGRSVSGVQSV